MSTLVATPEPTTSAPAVEAPAKPASVDPSSPPASPSAEPSKPAPKTRGAIKGGAPKNPAAPGDKADNIGVADLAARFRKNRAERTAANEAQGSTPTAPEAAPAEPQAPAAEAPAAPEPKQGEPGHKPTPEQIRIYKQAEKIKQLEEIKTQLEGKLAEGQPAPATPEPGAPADPAVASPAADPADPAKPETSAPAPQDIAHMDEIREIDTHKGNLAALETQLQGMEEGGEIALGNGEVVELSAEQVASNLQLIAEQRIELTARRGMLQQQAAQDYVVKNDAAWKNAHTDVPELADPESQQSKWAAAVVEQFPEVKRSPHFPQFIADALLGQQYRQLMGQADQLPVADPAVSPSVNPLEGRSATPQDPPPVIQAGPSLAAEDPAQAAADKAYAEYKKTGNHRDHAVYRKALSRARATAH